LQHGISLQASGATTATPCSTAPTRPTARCSASSTRAAPPWPTRLRRRPEAVFVEGTWAASPRVRAQALFEIADRLEAAKDEIAELVVAENGKLRSEALGETLGAISEARYYGGLARNIRGAMQEIAPGQVSLFAREAAGVAGIIVPWNAPVTLLLRSLAPALAAGCTAVIKPAHQTPLVHERLMQCFADCPSLPAGVVNSVNENGIEVGQAMVASRDIDVISFTGSSRHRQASIHGRRPRRP
jgi:betaine-aldehyde dehydrogenase